MKAYYNEFDPNAAAWLRELIKMGLIADGIVDERSIQEVRADDLKGYTQAHFFAGIGGWSYALRLAGWPDDRPVWTGSCPCQPFSTAGAGRGIHDPRHLWPEWFRLIQECRPLVCFGEQVANAITHNILDHLSTDLEGEGYCVGAAVLGAHSVGQKHIRQRLWWVADRDGVGQPEQGEHWAYPSHYTTGDAGEADWLFDAVRRNALPFLCPESHGLSAKLAKCAITGFGNAIVPQVAALFIKNYHNITEANHARP